MTRREAGGPALSLSKDGRREAGKMAGWLLVLSLVLGAGPVWASGGADLPFSFKPDTGNVASVQRGARNFLDYCAGCHSLKYVRYNRLGSDLGIPDDLLQKYLMPKGAKPGDTVLSAMPADAEKWFGRVPPDLSLSARARGPAWVYSYLRSFYLDPSKPRGVNNLVLPGASMPHVLGDLQGWQALHIETSKDAGKPGGAQHRPAFERVQPGRLSPAEYKAWVGDLSNFMVYAAEPGRNDRIALGWKVLAYILLFWGLAYLLKKEFWKDVH
ncbi:MAG: cytochrome c1 [Nevskiales bacterium]|nr:cytochrome c1 [Nevskiales bacterium]